MIVQGGDLDAAVLEALQDRIDLVRRQDEIAHDHDVVPHPLEREP